MHRWSLETAASDHTGARTKIETVVMAHYSALESDAVRSRALGNRPGKYEVGLLIFSSREALRQWRVKLSISDEACPSSTARIWCIYGTLSMIGSMLVVT